LALSNRHGAILLELRLIAYGCSLHLQAIDPSKTMHTVQHKRTGKIIVRGFCMLVPHPLFVQAMPIEKEMICTPGKGNRREPDVAKGLDLPRFVMSER
jgi:hypothetical protein